MKNSIRKLNLIGRTENALVRAGVENIEDLSFMTNYEIESIRGIGKQGISDIIKKLKYYDENNSYVNLKSILKDLLDKGYKKDNIINVLKDI